MTERELARIMSRNDVYLGGFLLFLALAIIGAALAGFVTEFEWETAGVVVTAIFTVVLAVSTIMLWSATKAAGARADSAIRTIERAYVKMSHRRPGVVFPDDGTCKLALEIKNFGRTPATVTRVLVRGLVLFHRHSLPAVPDYTEGAQYEVNVFLVTKDAFYYTTATGAFKEGDLAYVKNGQRKLYLYGYVEYTDAFGERHRAGYAKVYDHTRDVRAPGVSDKKFKKRTNLVFVAQEGYNYDICLDEDQP